MGAVLQVLQEVPAIEDVGIEDADHAEEILDEPLPAQVDPVELSAGAVVSMCTTLNAAYDITESRPWWKVRLIAIGLTIGLALFVLISMTLVIAGPSIAEGIAERAGLGPVFVWTWWILQWPLVFLLVATGLSLLYYFAPDAEHELIHVVDLPELPGPLRAFGGKQFDDVLKSLALRLRNASRWRS